MRDQILDVMSRELDMPELSEEDSLMVIDLVEEERVTEAISRELGITIYERFTGETVAEYIDMVMSYM